MIIIILVVDDDVKRRTWNRDLTIWLVMCL